MQPCKGLSLTILQEEMRHIRYAFIDEMSFIGPRLLIQIDSRSSEAFPKNKSTPFGERSVILVGDLGQLSLVKDKPTYAIKTTHNVLWEKFNIGVTLDIIFWQQGHDPKQSSF